MIQNILQTLQKIKKLLYVGGQYNFKIFDKGLAVNFKVSTPLDHIVKINFY